MFLEADKIRTLHCLDCDELISTNVATCKRCGRAYSPSDLASAADREDLLLKLDHDAEHALHTVQVSYAWYVLGLLLILWHARANLRALTLDPLAYLVELKMFIVTGVVIIPVFLAFALRLVIKWGSEFGSVKDTDPRVAVARGNYTAAWMHFAIAVACYLTFVLVPALFVLNAP